MKICEACAASEHGACTGALPGASIAPCECTVNYPRPSDPPLTWIRIVERSIRPWHGNAEHIACALAFENGRLTAENERLTAALDA